MSRHEAAERAAVAHLLGRLVIGLGWLVLIAVIGFPGTILCVIGGLMDGPNPSADWAARPGSGLVTIGVVVIGVCNWIFWTWLRHLPAKMRQRDRDREARKRALIDVATLLRRREENMISEEC
jgi:hypothetical protein